MSESVEERIAAIRQREQAATPGPWQSGWDGCAGTCFVDGPPFPSEWDQVSPHGVTFGYEEDAAFVAHARDDIPCLLAERDRLAVEVERLRSLIEPADVLSLMADDARHQEASSSQPRRYGDRPNEITEGPEDGFWR